MKEANRITTFYSRIARDMILFTKSDLPLPRTPKGGIQRKAALSLYRDDIDRLYVCFLDVFLRALSLNILMNRYDGTLPSVKL